MRIVHAPIKLKARSTSIQTEGYEICLAGNQRIKLLGPVMYINSEIIEEETHLGSLGNKNAVCKNRIILFRQPAVQFTPPFSLYSISSLLNVHSVS